MIQVMGLLAALSLARGAELPASGVFAIESRGRLSRERVSAALEQVRATRSGRELIAALESRRHVVTIVDDRSQATRNSTGVTTATIDADMSNGVGVPSRVQIDFSFPDSGSHCVVGKNGDWIAFPMVVNLFHELSHASHFSAGAYRHPQRISSEHRAIVSENLLRVELGLPERNPFDARGDWARLHPGGCSGRVPPEFEELVESAVRAFETARL